MNPHDYGDDYLCRDCGQSAFFDFEDTDCLPVGAVSTDDTEQPDMEAAKHD